MSASSIRSGSLSTNRFPVSFAAHGDYFVSGGTKGIQVWRVEDGHLAATIAVEQVQCVAFSKDGRWIAVGTYWGEVMVLDAKTYKQILTWNIEVVVRGVDFAPDSARLVAWGDQTTTIWDVTTRERVIGPLRHEDRVWAAKYSPQGNQIATATQKAVRILERNVAPVDIPVQVATGQYNTVLLWSNRHISIVSDGKVKQIDPSTRSVVAEWPVPDVSIYSCIAMPKHGQFITYAANRTVTFWDTSTQTHLGVVEHPQDIYSIALSQDGRSLAIGSEDGKITIKRLSRITVSIVSSLWNIARLTTFNPDSPIGLSTAPPRPSQEPDIEINVEAFHLWGHDQLANVDESLTEAISAAHSPRHQVFAVRALVRARLQQWEEAFADAKESLASQPSVMGFVAKSVSLVGKEKKHEAYRACDIAFQHSHSTHVNFLLLIKAVVVCMAGEHDDAISRVDDLISTLNLNSICYVVQARAYMHFLLGNARMKSGDFEGAIRSFERARTQLRPHTSRALSLISLISGWNFDDLDSATRRGLCEALYAAGRTNEAGETLLKMISSVGEVAYALEPTAWVSEFLRQYLSTPGCSVQLLKEWARSELTRNSWRDALDAAITFMASRFTIYQTLCEQLDTLHKILDATECLHQITNELREELNQHPEQMQWVFEFKQHLHKKLEYLGDGAMHTQQHDEAISRYSAALTLDPASPLGLLIKRSKAYVARGSWQNALSDADEVIAIDPSSPWGFERKHAALHKAERYDDAIDAFETMLLKISQSPDSRIRERHCEYVNPAQTKIAIRKIVQDTIRGSPRVLIHTISGRLLDKQKQAAWFESLQVFQELVSSMTTRIDYDHIQREVTHCYRYATFSHTWEDNEPVFEQVIHVVVYDLDDTFTHSKLQMFCKIARDSGLHWAWSDTCCINKSDHFILQEALVAMFKWYEGSAVTIIFLRGVHSPSKPGDLMRSIWNTRAWTFQEYHASKVVRFYTEEWAPYMNLDIYNHKECPEIISEMEEGMTSIVPRSSMTPGLQDIREKLCLASRRETTFIEDTAYSLLGIFSISLPIVYGEGDQALSRLLAQLLTSSGDTSILAWTGKSGTFNSCLPSTIIVFKELPDSHIPPAVTDAEMETNTARIRPNLNLTLKLYDHLNQFPVPSFANQRMKLPCLTFKLGAVNESASWSTSGYVFRARATALGVVEISTTEDLSRFSSLTLVHPWIDFLLDRQPVGILETTRKDTSRQSSSTGNLSMSSGPSNAAQAVKPTRTPRSIVRRLRFGGGDTESVQFPAPESLADRQMQALRFITRLRKPFGALLFTPNRLNVEEYKRVASETLVTVQVEELSPKVLNSLIDGARMLDVL